MRLQLVKKRKSSHLLCSLRSCGYFPWYQHSLYKCRLHMACWVTQPASRCRSEYTFVLPLNCLISQPVHSIFPCSPLPPWTWRTPGLSIPWCYLPTTSSVCLVFLTLSLCLARWFWPDLVNGRHVHTTAVCVSLQWWGPYVIWSGSWHWLPHW